VQKRPVRGSYTGYGKRLPSDRPPVQSAKELAMANADGGLAIQANGQAIGYEAPSGYEPSAADQPGYQGPDNGGENA
jgi:cell division protease FtsH